MTATQHIKNSFTMLLIVFTLNTIAVAQEDTASSALNVYPVNLASVLYLSGAQNLTVQMHEQRKAIAIAEHQKSKEWWLPTVYFGAMMHKLEGAAMNEDGFLFTDVNRANFWGGLGLNMEWDFGDNMYRSLAAKQRIRSTTLRARGDENQMQLQAVTCYFELQEEQAKSQTLVFLAEEAQKVVDQLQKQVDKGLLNKSHLLMAKSNYQHIKVQHQQTMITLIDKSARLANLLNLPSDMQMVVADSAIVPVNLIYQDTIADVRLASYREQGFNNRAEVKVLKNEIKALDIEQRTNTKGLLLPTLNLGTYDSYFGEPFTPTFNTYEVNVALRWQIPLGAIIYGGDKKKYEAKRTLYGLKVEEAKQIIGEEVSAAYSKMKFANEQIKLSEESMGYAYEALEITMERQERRVADSYEVFQAQEIYMRAMMDYYKAVRQYNQAQYSLYVAMGNDL